MHPSSRMNMTKAISSIAKKLPMDLIVLDVGGRNIDRQDRSYKGLLASSNTIILLI